MCNVLYVYTNFDAEEGIIRDATWWVVFPLIVDLDVWLGRKIIRSLVELYCATAAHSHEYFCCLTQYILVYTNFQFLELYNTLTGVPLLSISLLFQWWSLQTESRARKVLESNKN